jgi:dihydropteroate synthase
MIWQTQRQSFNVRDGGLLMGILNVTPDSFSDGGKFIAPEQALDHAKEMVEAGAWVIDIGGESTRPGSLPVEEDVEIERVVPVIEALRRVSDVLISVDTRKTAVAREALKAGADIVNDVEALRAPGMIELCAETQCGVIAMHMQGQPTTMQQAPRYSNVVEEVRAFFEERYESMLAGGMKAEQICWDPGIGFGKTLEHNLALIAHLEDIRVAGRPMMLALSRKRMIGEVLGNPERGRQALGTATLTVYGHLHGAQIHRVHDIQECADALALIRAVERQID